VARKIILLSLLMTVSLLPAAVAESLRDPLRPLGYQSSGQGSKQRQQVKAKTAEWHLDGVLIASDRSVAMINGRALQIGDLLEGYKLVKIEQTRVTLKRKKQKVVLHRSGTGLKKASAEDARKGSQP